MKKLLPWLLALALCFVCTAALAECDHSQEDLVPNEDGTHSHVCALCGEDLGKEECADRCNGSSGDGVCDLCGNTSNVQVYHDQPASCTEGDGGHIITCKCGEVMGTYPIICVPSDDPLMHNVGCRYCVYQGNQQAFHTNMGSGTYVDENTCSYACADCGYTYEGEHVAAMGGGDGFHGTSCYYCNGWTWKEDCYEYCADQDGCCDECGAPVADSGIRHDYTASTCVVSGDKHVRTCSSCNGAAIECDLICQQNDDMSHLVGCTYCLANNEDTVEVKLHSGMGSSAYVDEETCAFSCADCGYSYEGEHMPGFGCGDGFHGYCCNYCGAWTWKEDCYESCGDQDGYCDEDACGQPVSASGILHDYTASTCVVSGDKHVRACSYCNDAAIESDIIYQEATDEPELFHMVGCTYCLANGEETASRKFHTNMGSGDVVDPDTCSYTCVDCGYTHEGAHFDGGLGCDDGIHGTSCYYCNTWTWAEVCYEYCNDQDGYCDVCGQDQIKLMHTNIVTNVEGSVCNHSCSDCGMVEPIDLEWMPIEAIPLGETGYHVYTCMECGYIGDAGEPHTYTYTITVDTHQGECTACGWREDKEAHVYTDEDDLDCNVCGALLDCEHEGETVCTEKDGTHEVACARCGEVLKTVELTVKYTEAGHYTECEVCAKTSEVEAHELTYIFTDDEHTGTCDCGYTMTAAHAYTDDRDLTCNDCDFVRECEHVNVTSSVEGTKCVHVCSVCGEKTEYDLEWMPIEAIPLGETGYHVYTCLECNYVAAEGEAHTYNYTITADTHQGECTACGWREDKEAHVYTDENDLDCNVCGALLDCDHDCATVCTEKDGKHEVACARCGEVLKTVALTVKYTEEGHYTECEVCAAASAVEAHTITYTYTNEDHTAQCDVCGYKAEAEAHVYTDEDDNDCDVCGKTKQCQHTYWFNIWPAPTCTESGVRTEYCGLCGKVHSTSTVPAKGHDLSTEDMGDYLLETCSCCDYENRIEKQAEEQPAAPVVTDGLTINDVDMAEETAVQLPEDVVAAKVFTVAYIQDGESVQPETALTVTLSMTAEELSAVEGLKLMMILEDGTMVEVAYEVVDGKIVFTAEKMGAFAFIAE